MTAPPKAQGCCSTGFTIPRHWVPSTRMTKHPPRLSSLLLAVEAGPCGNDLCLQALSIDMPSRVGHITDGAGDILRAATGELREKRTLLS